MTGTHPLILAGPAAETTRLVAYWLLAILSVAAAVGMVLARRAVHCAMLLAVVMLSLAVFYAMLGAPFLSFVQIIVYTGAVLMLFLFVLMIVGISAADSIIETIRGQRMWAALAGIAMLVLLSLVVGHAVIGPAAPNTAQFGNGNVTTLANLIFTKYLYPFEVTSALLIIAAVGAMVLAHRERTTPKPTQRELAARRIASGRPAPLPGPGTYAQHNAADMPALLPDGSHSELSVSTVLSGRAGETPRELPGATAIPVAPPETAGSLAGPASADSVARPASAGGQGAGEQ
ncbi:MAG TPA: NADH-quinone oxidoreductase subunit J [Streptosporangiaceae bacterium]|nr:NADH-quinone oxidoreductase subunit J [Streptosporangiaceae bacterium]